MSAFIVSDEHIAAIVGSALAHDRWHKTLTITDAVASAHILANENARSVNTRYAHHNQPEDPPTVSAKRIQHYYKNPLTPVQLLKAIQSLDYQSCETDDWNTTQAFKLLQNYQSTAIAALPGYEQAGWAL